MKFKHAVIAVLALAGSAAAGLAQAQEPRINWSVTIGAPFLLPLPRLPVLVSPGYAVVAGYGLAPGYGPVPVYRVSPGYGVSPGYAVAPGYSISPGYEVVVPQRDDRRGDWDADGIPNRYDPVYNPRWDRDGDGIPNRYDRDDRNDRRDRRDRHADWHAGGNGGWHDGQRGYAPVDRWDNRNGDPRDDYPLPPRRGR